MVNVCRRKTHHRTLAVTPVQSNLIINNIIINTSNSVTIFRPWRPWIWLSSNNRARVAVAITAAIHPFHIQDLSVRLFLNPVWIITTLAPFQLIMPAMDPVANNNNITTVTSSNNNNIRQITKSSNNNLYWHLHKNNSNFLTFDFPSYGIDSEDIFLHVFYSIIIDCCLIVV